MGPVHCRSFCGTVLDDAAGSRGSCVVRPDVVVVTFRGSSAILIERKHAVQEGQQCGSTLKGGRTPPDLGTPDLSLAV